MKSPKQLVTAKLDRLGRSAVDVLRTVKELELYGCAVRVLQLGDVHLTSSAGKLGLTTLAAVAEIERLILTERTNAGLEDAQRDGRILSMRKVTTLRSDMIILEKLSTGLSVL